MSPIRTAALAAALCTAGVSHAAIDNDVNWELANHLPTADRRPLCPVNNENFDVLFQTAHNDLTSARVGLDIGSNGTIDQWVPAVLESTTGPVDHWRAALPSTATTRIAYIIELTDGTDVDYLTANGVSDQVDITGRWVLDFSTLEHAPMGGSIASNNTAVFRVWAPNAQFAHVRGTFNLFQFNRPMTKVGEDWIAYVPFALPGQEYNYTFNGDITKPDPYGRYLDSGDQYKTQLIDHDEFPWQHPNFTPADPEEWVVYQLHVGTFSGLNDPTGTTPFVAGYRDVADRVWHLADLGVNAVMLNPIYEFPGDVSGGYNSISAHAFESAYGDADDLKAMIDALHGAGIAVIIDTVWNHFPGNDNFLWNFDGTQVYFDSPPVGTPWGDQADIDNPRVSQYFFDSVQTVMGEYKMDGYRHDAIYELVGATQAVSGQNLIRGTMDLIRSRFPDTHVIGEIYNNSPWNTAPWGIDLDGQYHEAYKNAIYAAILDAGLGDPDLGRLASAMDGSGPDVEGDKVFNYLELHDEAWSLSNPNATRIVRKIDTTAPHDDRYALGRQKLGTGITILSQGMPAMLMGTEWAEDNGFETAKLDWSHRETYSGVLDFYRDLIGLRTTKPALFANSPINIFSVNDGANVMAWERSGSDGRSYVVIANFSNTDFSEYRIGLPRDGEWGVIINSEDAQYQGTGFGTAAGPVAVDNVPLNGFLRSTRLSLPAHGFILLQHEPEFLDAADCPGDADGNAAVNTADLTFVVSNLGAGAIGATGTPGDVDADGITTTADITLVVSNLGAACD